MAGKNPEGAAHMDVRRSRQGQDAPSANPRHGRGPGARSAEGARQGALSFGYFSLREQRKVTRAQARKLLHSPSLRVVYSTNLEQQQEQKLPLRGSLFFACAKKSNQKKAHPAARPPRYALRVRSPNGHFSMAHPCANEKRRASCAPPFGYSPDGPDALRGPGRSKAKQQQQQQLAIAAFSIRHRKQERTHTFNNKNSRSHELITRKNVSYSLRLTEM